MFRYLGVFTTVLITFSSAWLLNYAAAEMTVKEMTVWGVFLLVFALNIGKFLIWGELNNRYRLSETYPLTAVFFPLIFLFAVFSGESSLSTHKLIGLLFIVGGLYYFEKLRVEG